MTDTQPTTTFAFTFGMGYNLANNYVLVEAPDENTARYIFIEARRQAGELDGSAHRWSTVYVWDDFAQYARHNDMTEVDINTPIRWRDERNPGE